MGFKAYFDRPEFYQNKFDFYSIGSSPKLLQALLSYFEKNSSTLSEVNIALYLFNNDVLNQKLIELSLQGVKINIYTIPIEGYDGTNPKRILDLVSRATYSTSTKYDLAKKIFADHYKSKFTNYNLFFFPHMYLRSPNVKTFSRGNMPYSLHSKSFLFKHKGGRVDIAISSSNFAVRDLVKEENLLFIYNEKAYYEAAIGFFKEMEIYSINISNYDFKGDYSKFSVEVKANVLNEKTGFMAPFYYNSPFLIEECLKKIIRGAKKRIIIVGQHICPIDYEVNPAFHTQITNDNKTRSGFANILVEKAKLNVSVEILSQTFASGDSKFDSNFRAPANRLSFIKFYNLLKGNDGINYFVNENCHSKYIVVDDSVFISNFNYTPTQFIYLDSVEILKFENNPGKSYKGVYSEVGQFVVVTDEETVKKYVENYFLIKSNKNSIKVI